jgi:CRP-like cAMP-binding protein
LASFAPESLRSVPLFSKLPDSIVARMAGRFRTETVSLGNTLIVEGEDRSKFFIIAQGQVEVLSKGVHGSDLRLALLTEGEFFGETDLLSDKPSDITVRTITPCVLLTLSRKDLDAALKEAPKLLDEFKRALAEHEVLRSTVNRYGERNIDLVSGFAENVEIPETFVDYSATPKEYSLSSVQTVVRVHTRVSDLYNGPFDQLEEQMRLTIEGIKERQEWELINSKKFGLLHSADTGMRISTRYGAPTPDDLDELLALVWKKPAFFVAHPKAIAAFERECTWRGVPPVTTDLFGSPVITWRGVPLVACDKSLAKRTPKGSLGSFNEKTRKPSAFSDVLGMTNNFPDSEARRFSSEPQDTKKDGTTQAADRTSLGQAGQPRLRQAHHDRLEHPL